MKPIVIYPSEKSDKVTLTKKEFEDYLQQAYNSGYNDGYNTYKVNWWHTPITYPSYLTTNDLKITSVPPSEYTKITCDAANDIGG